MIISYTHLLNLCRNLLPLPTPFRNLRISILRSLWPPISRNSRTDSPLKFPQRQRWFSQLTVDISPHSGTRVRVLVFESSPKRDLEPIRDDILVVSTSECANASGRSQPAKETQRQRLPSSPACEDTEVCHFNNSISNLSRASMHVHGCFPRKFVTDMALEPDGMISSLVLWPH